MVKFRVFSLSIGMGSLAHLLNRRTIRPALAKTYKRTISVQPKKLLFIFPFSVLQYEHLLILIPAESPNN